MDYFLSETVFIGSLTCYDFFEQLFFFILFWELLKSALEFIVWGIGKLVLIIKKKFRKSK